MVSMLLLYLRSRYLIELLTQSCSHSQQEAAYPSVFIPLFYLFTAKKRANDYTLALDFLASLFELLSFLSEKVSY